MKPKRLTWVFVGLGVVAIAVTLFLITRHLNQPATGQVSQAPSSLTQTRSYGTKSYSGHQVSFSLDERYSLKATGQGAVGLDSFVFTFSGPYRQLAVAVDNLPAGGISEYPAIQTRRLHPDIYSQASQSYGGQNYLVFTARDGTEIGAFGVRGSRIVSVDLTMPEAQSAASADLSQILASLHWH